MAEEAVFRISGDAADAIRDLQKVTKEYTRLVASMRKGERQSERTKKAGDDMNKSFEKSVSQVKNFAGAFLGTTGAVELVRQVGSGIEKWDQYILNASNRANKFGEDMAALAILADPGTKGATVKKAIQAGRKYFTPTESINIFQQMKSELDDEAKAIEAVRYIGGLTRQGVDAESAKELLLTGVSGANALEPWQAATLPLMAGFQSGRDPKALAKAGPAMSWFDDKVFGWSVASQLAATGSEQQIREATQAVGRGLGRGSGRVLELFDRLDVGGGTRMERLQALRREGVTSASDLQAAGFESTEALNISNLLKGLDALANKYQSISTADKNLVFRTRSETEEELVRSGMTQMTMSRLIDEAKKEQLVMGVTGAAETGYAETGQFMELERVRKATEMRKRGYGFLLPEGGADEAVQAGRIAQFLYNMFATSAAPPDYKPIGSEAFSERAERQRIDNVEAMRRIETEIKGLRQDLRGRRSSGGLYPGE